MIYLFPIVFAFVPSLLWLFYYLHKDRHPEPKRMVLYVFVFGMLSVIPTFFAELGFKYVFEHAPIPMAWISPLFVFIGIAATEELFKFLPVRMFIFSNPALDEPVDLMLYMVISALGFAAAENIIVFFRPDVFQSSHIIALSAIRFLGATFLHTLASSLLGYFLALSYASIKNRRLNIFKAFSFAILLHGFFDLYILNGKGILTFLGPLAIFIIMAFFISFAFAKLRSMQSVCAIS